MSLTDWVEHVSKIEGRTRTALFHYYQPDQDEHLVDKALQDFVDALEEFSFELIEKVFSKYLMVEKKIRPNPAKIREACLKVVAARKSGEGRPEIEPETPRQRVTAAQAKKIMREAYGEPEAVSEPHSADMAGISEGEGGGDVR